MSEMRDSWKCSSNGHSDRSTTGVSGWDTKYGAVSRETSHPEAGELGRRTDSALIVLKLVATYLPWGPPDTQATEPVGPRA